MTKLFLVTLLLLLCGCSLTPAQLKALDGAVCHRAGYGSFSTTTSAVGGASKSAGVVVNGENCSIATQGTSK